MSDTTTSPLDYHEKQELGFLERLLLDRRFTFANALLFFCATISIALLSLLVPVLYFALMESSSMQATLGKAFMGLYVTDLRGVRVTFLRASARHWFKFLSTAIFFVGYLMAIFPPRRQGLHDMLAGCLVLKR